VEGYGVTSKGIRKMSWNYRIIKEKDYYYIGEVFYKKDGDIEGWTDPINILDEELDGLKMDYRLIAEAFKKPTLEVKGNKLKNEKI